MHKKYRKPNPEQKNKFNQYIKEHREALMNGPDTLQSRMTEFMQIIKKAAETTLTEVPPKQQKNYISEETWNLMERRQTAHEAGNKEEYEKLHKAIKKPRQKTDKINIWIP